MAGGTLSKRMDIVEEKVAALEELPARVTALEHAVAEFRQEVRGEFAAVRGEFATVRGEIHALEEKLRTEIREGDEETRRYMRVLHEDVIERIRLLGESWPR